MLTPIKQVRKKDGKTEYIAVLYNGRNAHDVMEFITDILGCNTKCYVQIKDGVLITHYGGHNNEVTTHNTWFIRTDPENAHVSKAYTLMNSLAFNREWIILREVGSVGK